MAFNTLLFSGIAFAGDIPSEGIVNNTSKRTDRGEALLTHTILLLIMYFFKISTQNLLSHFKRAMNVGIWFTLVLSCNAQQSPNSAECKHWSTEHRYSHTCNGQVESGTSRNLEGTSKMSVNEVLANKTHYHSISPHRK